MFSTNYDHKFDENKVIEAAENAEQTGGRQLWERQPGESAKAYSAFQKYLGLSSRRTLKEVGRMSSCSTQNVQRWSRRWFWVLRTQAYDVIEEERFREQCSRDRLAMRRRQVSLGVACLSVGAHAVRELQSRIASGQPLGLSPSEIKDIIAIGAQLEAKGVGTEGSQKYSRIIVHFGDTHRYAGEKCSCPCAACVAGCTGLPDDGKTMPALEAAYDDPDPKLN
jgi:hypothetical protein